MVNSSLVTLQAGYDAANNASISAFEDTILELFYAVVHSIYQTYGFEAPETESGSTPTAEDELSNDYNVITLVYIYFFVSVGVTLVLMGVLNLLTLPRATFSRKGLKQPGVWSRIGIFFVVGAVMAGLSGLIGSDTGANLSVSGWLLPAVTFGLILVLGVQYVRWPQKNVESEEGD